MVAIILNSGIGSRMGALTQGKQKSMLPLANGETLFARQLRLLHQSGVTRFVVTTGPYEAQLKEAAHQALPPGCEISFVNNPDYARTNYLYSLYLARDLLKEDVLLLHGDLVFDRELPESMLQDPRPNLVTVDTQKPLPEKDFKGRVQDGLVSEISIHAFGADCHALQPFYKLSKAFWQAWMARIIAFVQRGETGCYAENALNELMPQLALQPFECASHFIEEIDTPADYAAVCEGIRREDFARQMRKTGPGSCAELPHLLAGAKRPMLVCGSSYERLPVQGILESAGIQAVRFSGFGPNPRYEDIVPGVKLFREQGCDCLLSVGGGSAMDVAKCIKLFSALDESQHYLNQEPVFSGLRHIAVPTTAGTGSEATRYAVIYAGGEKQSVTHDCIFPEASVLDPDLLATLPPDQRKAGYLDAFCHAVESVWSIHADAQSRAYAASALRGLTEAFDGYFSTGACAFQVMLAAYDAGQAINLTQTTAAHAMCYKLTSLYHLAHGHAAALCLPPLWALLLDAAEEGRVSQEAALALRAIAEAMGAENPRAAQAQFQGMLSQLGIAFPGDGIPPEDLPKLAASVNPTRLKNFPLPLTSAEITEVYRMLGKVS